MVSTKQHPSLGKMPKAKGGSNRRLDHPSTGNSPGSVNNTQMNGTRHAGGKPHPSLGGPVQRVKNPPVNTYAVPGGKRTKVEKATW